MIGSYQNWVQTKELERRLRDCGGKEAARWCRLEYPSVVRHG